MSTGHPRNFGFEQCGQCGTWRPASELEAGICRAWASCEAQRPEGWDANGAPTGIDANGDAS